MLQKHYFGWKMFYFYSSSEAVQYKMNHRTLGLQKFTLPGENIIICLFQKILRSFRKANQGFFCMVSADIACSICTLERFSYRNFGYCFPPSLFMALQLHAAFCYIVRNENDQLLKPNTKFHVKLKTTQLGQIHTLKRDLTDPITVTEGKACKISRATPEVIWIAEFNYICFIFDLTPWQRSSLYII